VQVAQGYFGHDTLAWLMAELEDTGTTISTCLGERRFPFSWIEMKRRMRSKFMPPHTTEALWIELRCMHRCNFKDVFDFHSEYLRIGRMLNFDKSAPRGSHAFSIYKSMIISTEDLVVQSLEITLRDGEIYTLGNPMRIVENAAISNVHNRQTANTFASPTIIFCSRINSYTGFYYSSTYRFQYCSRWLTKLLSLWKTWTYPTILSITDQFIDLVTAGYTWRTDP
jgi:hypothetical protein